MHRLLSVGQARALNMTPVFVSYKLLIFAPLLVYVLLGNPLTTEVVFVTVAMMGPVRLLMTLFFPFAITFSAEAWTSAKRIQVLDVFLFLLILCLVMALLVRLFDEWGL